MSITVSNAKKRVAAIVSEYNPFHNGHKYHIEKTRESGADFVIAIMSGNTVQRGDVAIYNKHYRARMAVKNGVDLVIELPHPYSCSSAGDFAKGAISIIESLGIVDYLSFGCESGCKDDLIQLATAIDEIQDDSSVKQALKDGYNYPTAVSKAIEETYGEKLASQLNEPNNTLAVEYIRALKSLNSSIELMPIKRTGAGHNSDTPEGDIASASYIRTQLFLRKDASQYTPYDTPQLYPASLNKMSKSILLNLCSKGLLPDIPQELSIRTQNVLISNEVTTFSELIDEVSCKSFTRSRVSRELLCAYINSLCGKMDLGDIYARVLAFNENGRGLIKAIEENGKIAISTSLTELSSKNPGLAVYDNTTSRVQGLCSDLGLTNEFTKKFQGFIR